MMVFEFHSGQPVQMHMNVDFSYREQVENQIHDEFVKPVDDIHPWLFISPDWFQMISLMGQITRNQPEYRHGHGLVFVYEHNGQIVCDPVSTVDWQLDVCAPVFDTFQYTCTLICRNDDEYTRTLEEWNL